MTLPQHFNVPGAPAGIQISSRRRQLPNQPPNLLTTSLGNARNTTFAPGGLVQTPVSSITLSGPFSAHPQCPYPQSPGGALRDSSPMASRSASTFSGHYNPQQWGAVNSASPSSMSMVGEHRQISQSTRTAHLAPRLVGPDGKEGSSLARIKLIKIDRARRFSSTTVLTSSRSAVWRLTTALRYYLSCRHYIT